MVTFDNKNLIIVRGGGDIASGTIYRLKKCGFLIIVLEKKTPTFIRKTVSFAQAIYDDQITIQGITAQKATCLKDIKLILSNNNIPVISDEAGSFISILKPICVVDAIMAKKNLKTSKKMAKIVIALGPGFNASSSPESDVDAVVETNRGHFLGHVIYSGKAQKNTKTPGNIMGYTQARVIKATANGIVQPVKDIGDFVNKNDIVVRIGNESVKANINGIIRGMINKGLQVTKGYKIGDIDPRNEIKYCNTISDKSLAIAGGVTEALFYFINQRSCDLHKKKALN